MIDSESVLCDPRQGASPLCDPSCPRRAAQVMLSRPRRPLALEVLTRLFSYLGCGERRKWFPNLEG